MKCPNCQKEIENETVCPYCSIVVDSTVVPSKTSEGEELQKSMLLHEIWDENGKEKIQGSFESIYHYLLIGLLSALTIIEAVRLIMELF